MSHEEWRAFLIEGTRTAKVGVVRKDGSPVVAPVWFVLEDDDTIVFTTHRTTTKGYALRRDPRLALCVDDDRPPYAFVRIAGIATCEERSPDLLAYATRLGGRYMGADRAEEYGRRNAVEGEMVVRVRPERVNAQTDIAD
ncbi:MAG: pyridoxamine 5-phosphate oxidase [Solirubrobacterales bacterium]|jgi:PPOX class probable F420-dependent enzyme|nr:pyridoxamine 5-phosphate oxidase [Solirubrobacterales bacterium]